MYDIIVIGGGPAGMTSALYARRNNKTVLILEKNGFGGQITYSPKVENYPGTMSMSGSEFADRLMEQVIAQGADIEMDTVTGIVSEGGYFRVNTEESGSFEGKAVIIATGVKHRMLGIEGETALVGRGISFCAVCDGDFYSGQTVAVIGGGNSALQEAMLLSECCEKVIIVQNLDYFTGEKCLCDTLLSKANVEAVTGAVVDSFITENEDLVGVRIKDVASGELRNIQCTGLFVAVGLIPENEAFSNVASVDNFGYISSGEDCLTNTPGIFSAGDCRSKSIRQLTTAVADGAVAAVTACRYIDTL